MFFAFSVAVRISVAIREQRTRRRHQFSTRHGTLPRVGLVQGEKYGIAEQTVTDAPMAALRASGESALGEEGQGGDRWQMP